MNKNINIYVHLSPSLFNPLSFLEKFDRFSHLLKKNYYVTCGYKNETREPGVYFLALVPCLCHYIKNALLTNIPFSLLAVQ